MMEFVKPIKNREQIEQMKEAIGAEGRYRERVLFILGINSGLRISDLLNLRWKDVSGSSVTVKEQKTGKTKRFPLNDACVEALRSIPKGKPAEYIFVSHSNRNGSESKPWTRQYIWQILNQAAKAVGLEEVGTHTLRKTFAYHVFTATKNLTLVQKLLNHSSPATTLRYIGIEQEELNACYTGLNL